MGGASGLGEVAGGNGCKTMKCPYLCLFIPACITYGAAAAAVMTVNGLLLVTCTNNFRLSHIKIPASAVPAGIQIT